MFWSQLHTVIHWEGWWFRTFVEAAYCGKSQGFGIRPPCSCAVLIPSTSWLVMLGSPDLWNWSTFHGLVMIKWKPISKAHIRCSKNVGSFPFLLPYGFKDNTLSFIGIWSRTTCRQNGAGSHGPLVCFWNSLPGLCVFWLLICSQLECGAHSAQWTHCVVVLNESSHCHAWDSMSMCGSGLLRCLVQMRAEVPATWQTLDRALGMKIGRNVCIVRRQCLAKGPNASALISLTLSLCGESQREW